MARTNLAIKPDPISTHEAGPADRASLQPENALRRSVLSCLLWEREFYEDGQSIAARIAENAKRCSPEVVASLAAEARNRFHLRHAPLLLVAILADMAKGSDMLARTVDATVQRADELAELIAIRAKITGRTPKRALTHGLRKGMARAFHKFDAYALGKYDRAGTVRLRDALFLCHPKPENDAQAALWKSLVDGTLASPDTWEVALSAGGDKAKAFTRLLSEGKLGYLALLRNLRGMMEAGVDRALVEGAIVARKGAHNVLPFRYVAAARACPQLERVIDEALCAAIGELPALDGRTFVLVDVSGSMDEKLSAKSDLKRIDAAAALASIVNGDLRVFTFSQKLVEVPPRRGMAGVDAVIRSQDHGVTYLAAAVAGLNQFKHDRLIVITDEQSHDGVVAPVAARAYMINVASNQHGVGYGRWTHIDGFSENVLRYIVEHERS